MATQIPKAIRKIQSNEIVEVKTKRPAPKAAPKDIPTTSKKINKRDDSETDEEANKKSENVLSLKQAKFDVFKYGIKGFDKAGQQNAKMQLAMKLGAKPPKNECVNYKELLKKKQEEKRMREELLKENRSFEAKVLAHKSTGVKKRKTASARRKSKINRGHVGKIKGQIGSFSNGVLKISKHDLKKFKSKSK